MVLYLIATCKISGTKQSLGVNCVIQLWSIATVSHLVFVFHHSSCVNK